MTTSTSYYDRPRVNTNEYPWDYVEKCPRCYYDAHKVIMRSFHQIITVLTTLASSLYYYFAKCCYVMAAAKMNEKKKKRILPNVQVNTTTWRFRQIETRMNQISLFGKQLNQFIWISCKVMNVKTILVN